MNDLFDTAEKRESALNTFKNLLDSPGWQLIEKILDENIEVVKKQILSGLDEEGKKIPEEMIDRLRDKLKLNEDLKDLPKNMIKTFTTTETEVPNADPY
jgi:hypothetical protein